jgi:hypothetical protein
VMASYCLRPRNHTTPTQDRARWSGGLQRHGQQAAASGHHAGFNAAATSGHHAGFNAAAASGHHVSVNVAAVSGHPADFNATAATRAFDVPASAQLCHGLNSNSIGVASKRVRKEKLKKTRNWSDQQLKAALKAVDDGCPIQTAAKDYDIPRSSLRGHVMGTTVTCKRGRKAVSDPVEETKLVEYVHGMENLGHPVDILGLKLKVAEACQERVTPFRDGIPGQGWLRWFRHRHPEISLQVAQGLEVGKAKGLCPDNIASFYVNLEAMLEKGYGPESIWNCDESGAQAGRNGGGRVLAKTRSRTVHAIIPKEREWLSVLCCINAAGDYLPSFYIFRGKLFQRDFKKGCEEGATMGMQEKAWMTAHLFKAWIDHFVKHVNKRNGISPMNRHLLILDGHGSHVTMEVVKRVW